MENKTKTISVMKKSLLIISALALCGTAFAQSNENSAVVNIENEYTPEVIKVSKKGNTPTIAKDEEMEPLELEFIEKAEPFRGFTSERDIKDVLPTQKSQFPGYARLGYGLTNDIDAKLAYNLKTSKNGELNMLAGFDGFKTGIKGEEVDWDQRMFRTTAGASYTHRFKGLEMGVAADFSNRVFNYQHTDGYGTAVMTPGFTDKQNSRTYRLSTTGVSDLDNELACSYVAGVTYNRRSYSSGMEEGTGEFTFNLGGQVAFSIGEENLKNVGMDLGVDGVFYNSTLRNAPSGYTNYASFDINPFLNFDFSGWKVKIGTRVNFITANGARVAVAPDIKIKGNFNKFVGMYGEITGGRSVNRLADIEEEMPYWGFNGATDRQLCPTYRVVDLKAGAHLTIEPVSFDVYAGYAYTKDDVLQTMGYQQDPNSSVQAFRFIYAGFAQQNTHNFFVGGRAGCDIGGWTSLSAEARYDKWGGADDNLLMMKPQITAEVNADFRVFEKLTFRLGYNFTRYTKGDSVRYNCKNDLYARASYQIFDWLGAYIQGNNLLNCDYYEYAGYRARGARGSLGVTANF